MDASLSAHYHQDPYPETRGVFDLPRKSQLHIRTRTTMSSILSQRVAQPCLVTSLGPLRCLAFLILVVASCSISMPASGCSSITTTQKPNASYATDAPPLHTGKNSRDYSNGTKHSKKSNNWKQNENSILRPVKEMMNWPTTDPYVVPAVRSASKAGWSHRAEQLYLDDVESFVYGDNFGSVYAVGDRRPARKGSCAISSVWPQDVHIPWECCLWQEGNDAARVSQLYEIWCLCEVIAQD